MELKLDLLYPKLVSIEAAHGKDISRCLMECLALWLTAPPRIGPSTWELLAVALERIGGAKAAEGIHKN